jgi:hypothetical protein
VSGFLRGNNFRRKRRICFESRWRVGSSEFTFEFKNFFLLHPIGKVERAYQCVNWKTNTMKEKCNFKKVAREISVLKISSIRAAFEKPLDGYQVCMLAVISSLQSIYRIGTGALLHKGNDF